MKIWGTQIVRIINSQIVFNPSPSEVSKIFLSGYQEVNYLLSGSRVMEVHMEGCMSLATGEV